MPEARGVATDQRRAPDMVVAVAGHPGDEGAQGRVFLRQRLGIAPRQLAYGRFRLRRHRQHPGPLNVDSIRRRFSAIRPFEDEVDIRAAEAECTDACQARSFRQCLKGSCHPQAGALPVDQRIRLDQVQLWRYFAMAQQLHRLDHASHAGGGIEVPHVGLDRSHQQRFLPLAEDFGQRRQLDRIAQGRSGPVGLDIGDVVDLQPRSVECRAYHSGLGTRQRPLGEIALIWLM